MRVESTDEYRILASRNELLTIRRSVLAYQEQIYREVEITGNALTAAILRGIAEALGE